MIDEAALKSAVINTQWHLDQADIPPFWRPVVWGAIGLVLHELHQFELSDYCFEMGNEAAEVARRAL